jgi:hypothetical protein
MPNPQAQSDPFAAFGGAATTPAAPVAPAPAAPNPTQAPAPVANTSAPQFQDAAPDFSAFGGAATSDSTPKPLTPDQEMSADKSIGPEEQAFLKTNKDYKYLPADKRFPNRPPGIYPTGKGNEWRTDPDGPMANTTQAPIDLHLLKHSAQGAAIGAAGTLPAMALPVIAPVAEDLAGLGLEHAEYYGKQAGQLLKQIAVEHPKAALAAKAYGTWLAGHVASKLGIPMPKIVKVLADL